MDPKTKSEADGRIEALEQRANGADGRARWSRGSERERHEREAASARDEAQRLSALLSTLPEKAEVPHVPHSEDQMFVKLTGHAGSEVLVAPHAVAALAESSVEGCTALYLHGARDPLTVTGSPDTVALKLRKSPPAVLADADVVDWQAVAADIVQRGPGELVRAGFMEERRKEYARHVLLHVFDSAISRNSGPARAP